MTSIDFSRIRAVRGSQHNGFEEMVCQLAHLEPPVEGASWFRGDGRGGDGGVEAYWALPADKRVAGWTLADGAKVGWQAKYHPNGDIDWVKVEGSIRTALNIHPTLQRYIVAFPCNLTPITARSKGQRGRPQKSGQEHWGELVSKFPGVTLELWNETELIRRLIRRDAEHIGIKTWFFDVADWPADWFRRRFDIAAADLGERYHADEHVVVEAAEAFKGLARTSALRTEVLRVVSEARDDISEVLKRAESQIISPECQLAVDAALRLVEYFSPFPKDVFDRLDPPLIQRMVHEFQELLKRVPDSLSGPMDVKEGIYGLLHRKERRGPLNLTLSAPLYYAIEKLLKALTSPVFLADRGRQLLLIGTAGIGKSHLLAEITDRATRDGRNVLLVPGQWLNAGSDPWEQLKARWEAERFSTEQVLGALNAAAKAADVRTLILVDAINESIDAGLWRNNLAGLIKSIQAYPCLAVAVSCRSDYLDWVLPQGLKESLVTVECKGFSSPEEQERAAQVFLDRRGIARPAVPWLAPDFTNPLFLRVTAEGLWSEGRTVYPQMVGLPEFFGFFLASLAARPPFVGWGDKSLLRLCLLALAREMVKRGRPWLSAAQATSAIRQALERHDGDGSPSRALGLLDDLKRGVLLPLPDPIAEPTHTSLDEHSDGFGFVFQRLGDLLIAEVVVDHLHAKSFKSGELAFVGRDVHAWAGLLGALTILLPQRRGVELPDLLSARCWMVNLLRALGFRIGTPYLAKMLVHSDAADRRFRDSLLWRTADAFMPRTEVWFHRLPDNYRIEVFVRLAPVPGHPWNADWLDKRLRSQSLPERDFGWSVPLALVKGDAKLAVDQIIDWAQGPQCLKAENGTLRLTAILLTWMLTTSARPIRDRATKALAHLFLVRPAVMTGILDSFHVVDDPYVVERLWAAAYGAAMNSGPEWPLAGLAAQTWLMCFVDGCPPVSLRTRDHAQGIIELAKARGMLSTDIVPERCQPPYTSDWPLEEVGEGFVESQRNTQNAWDIASSVGGMGDFGTYKVRIALERWSTAPLTDLPPLTGEQRYDTLAADLEKHPSADVRDGWSAYQEAEAVFHERRLLLLLAKDEAERASILSACDGADPLDGLLALLPSEQAKFAKEAIDCRRDKLAAQDADAVGRWVIKRAVDLGWTAERFGEFEKSLIGHDRERPEVERIGKKYQWIALDELLARLSDHVHHIGSWPEQVTPYRTTVDQPFIRDCDPSILAPPDRNYPWWGDEETDLAVISIEKMRSWVESDQDVPISPNLFDRKDDQGRQRLVLHGMLSKKDGDSARRRDCWSRVTSVLVRKVDRPAVVTLLRGQHLSDPSKSLPPPEFTDDGYLGEFPWRCSWPVEATGHVGEREGFGSGSGHSMIWPVIAYHWEAHLDLSLNGARVHLPSGWLLDQMGLSAVPLRPGLFADANGECLFQGHSAGAVIDRQRFLAFLEGSDWDCLWLIGGEKNFWPDGMGVGRSDRWACRYHSAIYWWENGAWQSQDWSDFDSRGV